MCEGEREKESDPTIQCARRNSGIANQCLYTPHGAFDDEKLTTTRVWLVALRKRAITVCLHQTVANNLEIEPLLLELVDQRQRASERVWLCLPEHLLGGLDKRVVPCRKQNQNLRCLMGGGRGGGRRHPIAGQNNNNNNNNNNNSKEQR